MADTTYSVLSNDVRKFIAAEVLSVVARETRLVEFGQKAKLESAQGKTFYATRYNRVALPQSALSEGVSPTATAISISQINCVADQWGATVRLTDVAELTVAHPLLRQAIELMGMNAVETTDREVERVLAAGTTVYYGDLSVATRTLVTTSLLFVEAAHKKIVAALRQAGARGFSKPKEAFDDPILGDEFVCLVDPAIELDVTGFTGWKDANTYANAKRLWNGEAGTFSGVRFVRSNFLPILTSAAAVAATSPASPAGTFTTATYQVIVTAVNNETGVEEKIYQPDATVFTNLDSLAITAPATAGYTYNIYVGTAGGAATTAILASSGNAPSAAVVVLAPPVGTAAVPVALNAADSKLHRLYYIGKDAYTTVHLQNLQTYLTPLAESDSDPLIQRRTVGWKAMFKAIINNESYLARLECESAYDI